MLSNSMSPVKAINFFVVAFSHFAKRMFCKKEYSLENSLVKKKKITHKGKLSVAKNRHNCRQYEWVLQYFFTFIFLISPNLAKYTCELSSLEQHHKIEEKNTG
jgi:hypothetical protein